MNIWRTESALDNEKNLKTKMRNTTEWWGRQPWKKLPEREQK